MLERPRLLDALDEGLSRPLTLVTAPAGYGKSALLLGWFDRHPDVPFIHLTLDERDNDPGRLWQGLIDAFSQRVDTFGQEPAELTQVVTPASLEPLVSAVCSKLRATSGQVVVVLDDFHTIDAAATLESIEYLRDEMPSSVHLVIAGRYQPRLHLDRLRLQGALIELREVDLRFTLEETRELLSGSRVAIDGASVVALHERTEGWGAALRLAILAIQRGTDAQAVVADLVGSQRTVADYLLEEVIGGMEPDLRRFVYDTSVVEELDGELAAALSHRDGADGTLERLAADGVFTTRVDQRPGWFRYHRLFRDLLRARLRAEDADRFSGLNRLAAEWHSNHGQGAAAVRRALDAGDPVYAARLLAEAYPSLVMSGRTSTALDLSGRILDEASEADALMLMTRFYALYSAGAEPEELDDVTTRLEAALEALPGRADTDTVHGGRPSELVNASSLPWLRGLAARARGDLEAVMALDDPEVIPSPSGRVEGWLAEGLLWLQQPDEAEPLIRAWLDHAERDGYLPSITHGLGLEALRSAEAGELGQSRVAAMRALELAARGGIESLAETMYARLVATWLDWMTGELTRAEDSAVEIQRFSERTSDVPVLVQHALLRSRIRWSLGDRSGARSLLDNATVTVSGRSVSGFFADRIALGRATLDLLDRDHEAAQRRLPDWRQRLSAGPTTLREHLVLLRLLVATGGAIDEIDRPQPDPHLGLLGSIEFARVRAIGLVADGRHDEAVEALAGAISRAQTIGLIQPIIDDRAALAPVLAAALRQTGSTLPGLGDEPAGGDVYVEPLSERERTILEQMATHLSYPEIADELYISPHTVRAHAKAIYRKLAVSSRSEAVARGHAYGLIAD